MGNDANANETAERQKLASRLTVAAVAGITLLGFAAIYYADADKQGEAAGHVLSAVLPLFGTWVATVLAYYFAKENLRAATSSVAAMMATKDTTMDAPVKDKMIETTRIVSLSDRFTNLPATPLKEIVDYLTKWNVSRSPIFDTKKCAIEIVHTSTINDYVQQQVAAGTALAALKYSDLQADLKLGKLIKTSMAFVAASATLAMARAAMTATPSCEDVFVTKTGKPDEPVLGWITDNVILEAGQ